MTKDSKPFGDAEALRRLRELWEWAVKKDRPFLGFLIGMAILGFDMDRGGGDFGPRGKPHKDLAPSFSDKVVPLKRGRPPKNYY